MSHRTSADELESSQATSTLEHYHKQQQPIDKRILTSTIDSTTTSSGNITTTTTTTSSTISEASNLLGDQIESGKISTDLCTEEDVQSCWSDSGNSNCDRNSGSQTYRHHPTTLFETSSGSAANSNEEAAHFADQLQLQHGSGGGGGVRQQSAHKARRCNTNKPSAGQKNVRKRRMANERERERTRSLNQALETLRNRLPVPEAEKRSKIQTLRMAKEYIEFLGKLKLLSQQQQQQGTIIDDSPEGQHYSKTLATNSPNNPAQNYTNDSPLTYKFYKFRLKSQPRND